MKKLYTSKNPNKRIHPSPLSFLPSALTALASALSPDDQLVLSYLLASHSRQQRRVGQDQGQGQGQSRDGRDHPPDLGCSCFGCYKSFWARWDSSPDRHVIHAILDAFEEDQEASSRCSSKKKKDGKGGKSKKKKAAETKEEEEEEEAAAVAQEIDDGDHALHEDEKTRDDGREEGDERSSVRRFFGWVFGIINN